MSSKERRAQIALERENADRVRAVEENRRLNLTVWERIEEADASDDVKELLHMFADKLGLEA